MAKRIRMTGTVVDDNERPKRRRKKKDNSALIVIALLVLLGLFIFSRTRQTVIFHPPVTEHR